MKPLVAIIGRPNVGKSTLFNRIAGKQKAVIDDLPGMTRDRNYAETSWEGNDFILIDTGGFISQSPDNIDIQIREQAQLAIEEADSIIFLADGKSGISAADIDIVRMLQCSRKPLFYVINKVDGPKQEENIADFFQFGVDRLIPISAKHKLGITELMSAVTSRFPAKTPEAANTTSTVNIAIVGRPNVGKSSLINKLLGNKRLLTSDSPGTTRDSIDTHCTFNNQDFLLIDTAGIRRKSRVSLHFEKFCIIEALKSMDRCDIAVLLIDASEGVTQQDAKIAHLIHEKGKAAIIGVNKWDLISKDNTTYNNYLEDTIHDLSFFKFAPVTFLSALTGQRAFDILKIAPRIYTQYRRRIQTSHLNNIISHAMQSHSPPLFGNKKLKFYYSTQIDEAPPHFVIVTNYPKAIHPSYKRFLIKQIRENYGFEGTPIRLTFKQRKR